MKHLLNICNINCAEVEPVDVITFGSPCQDLSVTGKGHMDKTEYDKAMSDTQWQCTVCGRIGTVGRCCGTNTRIPLNEAARDEQRRIESANIPICVNTDSSKTINN